MMLKDRHNDDLCIEDDAGYHCAVAAWLYLRRLLPIKKGENDDPE